MNRRFLWVFVAVWGCWSSESQGAEKRSWARASDEEVKMVGTFGDLTKLVLRGNEGFSDEHIREVLRGHFFLQAACRPTASLSPLVQMLEELLQEAYRHSGFPDATVRITVADGEPHLLATIVGGPRYVADAIRVEGVTPGLAEKVRDRLSTATSDIRPRPGIRFFRNGQPLALQKAPEPKGKSKALDDSATEQLWVRCYPVVADKRRREEIDRAIADTLATHGYPLDSFQTAIVPAEEGRATLKVSVSAPATAINLDSIVLTGLERHSREDVLQYMGLEPGQTYDLSAIIEAYDRLRDCCRFWQHDMKIELATPADPDDLHSRYADDPRTTLIVNLLEYTHVAKLGEPLAEEDAILQKSGIWMRDFFQGDGWDVCARMEYPLTPEQGSGGSLDAIVAPSRGVIAAMSGQHRVREQDANWQFEILSTANQISLTDARKSKRWNLRTKASPTVNIGIEADGIVDGRFKSSFSYGMGIATGKDVSTYCQVNVDPVVWVHFLHRENSQWTLGQGVLEVLDGSARLRVNAETGRILSLEATSEDGSKCFVRTVASVDSDFSKRQQQIRGLAVGGDTTRTSATLLDWALTVFDQAFEGKQLIPPQTRDRLRRLMDSDLGRAIDEKVAKEAEADRTLVWELQLASPHTVGKVQGDFMLPYTVPAADQLFVRESWPWTVHREVIFYMASKGDAEERVATAKEIARARSRDDTGPIFYWTNLALRWGYAADAANGLTKFTDGSFTREVEMLTTPDTGMIKLLATVVPVVQSLPEEDTNWLCGLAGDDVASKLEEVTRLLRKLDASSDEALQASLRELLEGEIRERVEADLRAAASAAE
jgi:hypothetical protein